MERIKEKITTDLLITDIKKNKMMSLISLLFVFIFIAAIAAYIICPLKMFSFANLFLIILAVFAIVALVVMYNGHSIVRQIKCKNIDIYEDTVTKQLITRGGKGTLHYLMFQNYRPHKEPGVRVSEKQYNECELNDRYYIICIKTTANNPYLLVYPTNKYMLSEDMAERIRK